MKLVLVRAPIAGWPKAPDLRRRLARFVGKAGRAPLEWRFLVFSIVVLVAGALVIGTWTAREIRGRVLQRTAATNALYVDSFVSPLIQPLEGSTSLPAENVATLKSLLADTELGKRIVSFKIWSTSGDIVYAIDDRLLGQHFQPSSNLRKAAAGEVVAQVSHLDDEENRLERVRWERLFETYAPIHSNETGRVIAVSEFYQMPDEILGEVRSSELKAWLIVGIATLVMFIILNGMVRQASGTIRKQNVGLQRLHERLRVASASRIDTEERVMSRVAQDLHDVPAQSLALALLRLRALEPAAKPETQDDWDVVRHSIENALADLRDISSRMRIPELGSMDVKSVVSRAAADFSQKTGRTVQVHSNAGGAELSLPAKAALYRVVQEALNNSFLHAQCTAQAVSVAERDGWLRLDIGDDGIGFDPNRVGDSEVRGERSRLGLRGMRDRVELLGGTLTVNSRPGTGTTVVALIPAATGPSQ